MWEVEELINIKDNIVIGYKSEKSYLKDYMH